VTTWILILTITAYHSGVSIESVPGFATKELCLEAGNFWLLKNKSEKVYGTVESAICIEQK
jgi:hypothetical protein